MKAIIIGSTKHLFLAAVYASIGIVVALLATGIYFLNARPELSLWHTVELKNEFHYNTKLANFNEYLALEDRLFAEVERKVVQKIPASELSPVNRYVKNSLSDPAHWPQNWNRSYEWPVANAEFGVLLLHGMSDSPYALSNVAVHFKGKAHVLGLRLPGHGTIPSGLTELYWQDLATAVNLATAHMRQTLKDKPLFVVAFSTGAAVALNHELERISHDKAPDYDGMIFISPAIGLAPSAAAARWQSWIGRLLELDKLQWNSIQVEYDPFKYTSFAVNAGDVVYQLALRNQGLLAGLTPKQRAQVPSILTFQSVVDATVSTAAVVNNLYQTLPEKGHELVLFDMNRLDVNAKMVSNDPLAGLLANINNPELHYRGTVVENISNETTQVQARSFGLDALGNVVTEGKEQARALDLYWPAGVYSLSHVALPFGVDDGLYGAVIQPDLHRIQIGASASRGERGLYSVSASEMLRQKWNPFFPYLLERMDEYRLAHMHSH
ncbi:MULTISPECIES: alpha/beta hydrolase [unclassified Shewanella]|uniref:alpha/beta hydrolase n=1 Tax=unclassified Shewanella TaxID=196818 RepID=UPI0021D94226|nr:MULTISPECIES: alpha/beta fold hydrolase [unclassified Shewanella]MCU8004356.1 alpha/beta fold hydrolase [Shewanella sp. SM96]MCU8060665.1 alpha/beta fold hydrolase [Shewanella sp. SM55]MCU8087706.1 alpha/beta fold hydrolase [Shewanella sp. SM21]